MSAASTIDYWTTCSVGVSEAAEYVYNQANEIRNKLQDSYVLGLRGKGVFSELRAVTEECSEPNWDGYGAEPITETSYLLAHNFLLALPIGSLAPVVSATPDGQLTLEWYHSPFRVLSISFDPEGLLHYAALLGPASRYGVEPLYGNVPRTIAELIRQIPAK